MKKITLMLCVLLVFCWQSNAQLNEGFDAAGLPTGWTETELVGADANWESGATNNQNSSVQPRTGAGMAYFYEASYNGETTRLETPSQDLTSLTTPILTFYYTQVDWGGDQDQLSIWYKDGAAGTWTMLSEYTGSVSAWTEVNIILPSASADYYIGFQGFSGYGRGVTIDDVAIGEAPNCLAPGDLGVTVTTTTETMLNWTATGSETDFTYEYGDTGFIQGAGTTGMVTGLTTPISGLTPGTTYDFYVQANCGVDGDSGFSGPFTWIQPNEGESCATAFMASLEADCGTATPISLDFTGAPSNISTSCDTFNNYGLWVTAMTDAAGGLTINASVAVDMAVFDACGGSDIACYEGGISPSVNVALSPNTQYYLYFWQEGTASTAMVDVCIASYTLAVAPDCAEAPTVPTDTATGVMLPGGVVNLSWTAPSSGPAPTDYELFFGDTSGAITSIGLLGSTDTNVDITGLDFGTTYYWSILPYNDITAATNTCSEWSFTTDAPPTGYDCNDPILVGALPYNTTDDTGGYGDVYSGTPGATNCGTTSNYLNGDDVVYAYTATADGTIKLSMSGIGSTYSGIFVYTDCANIGTECVAGFGNGASTADYELDVAVTNGTTYYVVISTWAAPQSTAYTLDITEVLCADPSALSATSVTATSADLGWTENGTAASWNIELGEAGFTPTGVATAVSGTNPYLAESLTDATAYEFYVQADCSGSVSAWVGPFAFSTLCLPISVDYSVDMSANVPDSCWNEAGSGEVVDGPMTMGASDWKAGRAYTDLDSNVIDSNVINLYQTVDREWLISPVFDLDVLGTVGLLVNVAVTDYSFSGTSDATNTATMGSDDEVQLLMTADAGATWANVTTWNVANQPAVTGTEYILDLSGMTGSVQFAFFASDGTVDDTEDYDFHVGTFTINNAVLSTTQFENEAAFTYYPNPVKNTLILNAQNTIEQIAMYNMLGQEVLRATPNSVESSLDMSNLQTGTYFVKVTIANVTETIRVIKQ